MNKKIPYFIINIKIMFLILLYFFSYYFIFIYFKFIYNLINKQINSIIIYGK